MHQDYKFLWMVLGFSVILFGTISSILLGILTGLNGYWSVYDEKV